MRTRMDGMDGKNANEVSRRVGWVEYTSQIFPSACAMTLDLNVPDELWATGPLSEYGGGRKRRKRVGGSDERARQVHHRIKTMHGDENSRW